VALVLSQSLHSRKRSKPRPRSELFEEDDRDPRPVSVYHRIRAVEEQDDHLV
jgi:hypothetical protein